MDLTSKLKACTCADFVAAASYIKNRLENWEDDIQEFLEEETADQNWHEMFSCEPNLDRMKAVLLNVIDELQSEASIRFSSENLSSPEAT